MIYITLIPIIVEYNMHRRGNSISKFLYKFNLTYIIFLILFANQTNNSLAKTYHDSINTMTTILKYKFMHIVILRSKQFIRSL